MAEQSLRWAPSLRGWAVILIAIVLVGALLVFRVHGFLAVNHPIQADALVVEGWISDRAFKGLIGELQRREYGKVYTTGGPVEWHDSARYGGTYAGYCAMKLQRSGYKTNAIVPVPSNDSDWERTFHSAAALRDYFKTNHCAPAAINVITMGPHARRTRLIFQRALGNDIRVGIISLRRDDYDPEHWWRSSTGVREVVSEAAAYAYCRIVPSAFTDREL
jgi:hypothetical protein